MNASEFISKWRHVELTERASAHSHFLDLCQLVGHPTPVEVDPKGEWFTFERGVMKRTGKRGWADVWKREFFAFEYKGKHKDLNAAYDQLLLYRNALENPPLLVTCDIERLVIHTNFTGTVERVHEIKLAELASPDKLDILQWVFHDPRKLEPTVTREAITNRVAGQLGKIAQGMRERGLHPRAVAKFLNRLVFCMFAEDVGLLPSDLFTRIIDVSHQDPGKLAVHLKQLFTAMATGGTFGLDPIRHFNGNLFEDAAVILPTVGEMGSIKEAARLDWSQVDPSIFGTLFERGMDPDKRSQLGAHYTSRQDIETLIEPVVMAPLRREWAEVRRQVEQALGIAPEGGKPAPSRKGARKGKAAKKPDALIRDFLQRLQSVTVLDPACGSGNFLYVALQKLKDLEQETLVYFEDHGFGRLLPLVGARQLLGLEINPYAFDLAQMTVWIGDLQWQRSNGYRTFGEPVLQRLDTFRCMDSIIDLTDPGNPKEPEWPEAEFIVGNPPFLGDKLMRGEFGNDYVEALRRLYAGRLPAQSDLCCYWFEKTRDLIERGKAQRAGLLSTQGIRGGANREVLKRIERTGGIFFAESDRSWFDNGTNVHISMIGFDGGVERRKMLNGIRVTSVNSNLTSDSDTTKAKPIFKNSSIAFIGTSMHGPFDFPQNTALKMISSTGNPDGRVNSDVVRPILNALEIARRPDKRWAVYFPSDLSLDHAERYEKAFEYVRMFAKPVRDNNSRKSYRDKWWIHGESRPAMILALKGRDRFLVTPRVGKFRLYVWVTPEILPSDATVAFALSDDYSFGVLHSKIHEVWSLNLGTRLETRPRYTPTTCFETFPFPAPTDTQRDAVASAARDLDALRSRWLNPPEWTRQEVLEFPGSVDGPWSRFVSDPDERGIGTVRYPVIKPGNSAIAKDLADRTLTKLYNNPPAWLQAAHRKLDAAVCDAYGWEPGVSDDEILSRLLALNLERSEAGAPIPESSEAESSED